MAIKTAEQIAQDVMDAAFDPDGTGICDVTEVTDDQVYRALIAAVEAGQAQPDPAPRVAEKTSLLLAKIAADLNDDGPADLPDWRFGSPRAEYLRGQMELIADFAGISKESALILIQGCHIAAYIREDYERA